ncbi:unnamed protein product [Clonostachys rosea]|uniref:F-box domain-containing protein n=1 Tax=Bionectria ochroleuca TaxID=29856 RepID=A0ABY6U791_BIOOC|nr:unnamed protein product [Clonostachys rosea]
MDQLPTKPGPTTLLTLPPEIQHEIFSYLTASYGKPTIQAVLRTCKQLYEVALPLSVSVFRNAAPYPKDEGVCSRARNLQFLRYILVSKPWLAKYVKTVITGRFTQDGDGDGESENERTISDHELAVYQHIIEFSFGEFPTFPKHFLEGVPWSVAWVRDLKSNSDAQFALILVVCPNIQTILMETSMTGTYLAFLLVFLRRCWKGIMKAKFPHKIIPLSNLQDFFHEARPSMKDKSFTEGSQVFYSPRMRVYEGIEMELSDEAGYISQLPRRSSPVEEITLYQSIIEAGALFDMLGACRALKKFEMTCYNHSPTNPLDATAARDVLDAVLPHASTLEHLYISRLEAWRDGSVLKSTPERLYMGARLREMHALKTLTVGMQALTGMLAYSSPCSDMPLMFEGAPRLVDCLPENIESLTIHSCGPQILEQLEELVEALVLGGRFKNLTYIGLLFHAWKVDTKEVPAHMRKMEESFRHKLGKRTLVMDAGLQCEQAYRHDSWSAWDNTSDRPGQMMSRIYAPGFRRLFLQRRMKPAYALSGGMPLYDPVLLAS